MTDKNEMVCWYVIVPDSGDAVIWDEASYVPDLEEDGTFHKYHCEDIIDRAIELRREEMNEEVCQNDNGGDFMEGHVYILKDEKGTLKQMYDYEEAILRNAVYVREFEINVEFESYSSSNEVSLADTALFQQASKE